MRPEARVQTAIEILDEIAAGKPAERALTSWARRSRFAGSKDRAAVRDHVYDVLRQKRSCAAVGGGETGRALMIGLLALQNAELDAIFTGETYAPARLMGEAPDVTKADAVLDLPDWSIAPLRQTLGEAFSAVEVALKSRADVHLRCNLIKADRETIMAGLEQDGITTKPSDIAQSALVVTEGARKIANSQSYKSGLVELQDASSQAAIEALPLKDGMRVLDLCAGGGGKLLAMAGRVHGTFFAHDINQQRMRDIPDRAKRAGVQATLLKTNEIQSHGPFDLVFCDVPCSGSGSWRRDPEGKWRMNSADLDALCETQAAILKEASALVAPDGVLAYATCSMVGRENQDQVSKFLQSNARWTVGFEKQWTPLLGCDGFFLSTLRRV